jgi:ATP-dependent DNA ligase
MTEDHPLDYATFEGVIPKGEYGGGQVIVWDAGIYGAEENGRWCFDRQRADELVRKGIKQGKLSVFFAGSETAGRVDPGAHPGQELALPQEGRQFRRRESPRRGRGCVGVVWPDDRRSEGWAATCQARKLAAASAG